MLRSLEQARVLADALRVRILGAYGGEARTTKQLAEILGEKPGKLYHHVEALEKAELIRLERTRQVRGTLEKYYRPVADSFKADPTLFNSAAEGDEKTAAVDDLVSAAFEGALDEVRAGIDMNEISAGEESILSRLHVHGSARRIEALREQLAKILKFGHEDDPDEGQGEEEQAYGLFIAFYPLAKPKPRKSE